MTSRFHSSNGQAVLPALTVSKMTMSASVPCWLWTVAADQDSMPSSAKNARMSRAWATNGLADEDDEAFKEMVNDLPNLQLLEGSENVEKLAFMPADWITRAFPTAAARTNYCNNHLLGEVPESLSGFREFYTARREAMHTSISEMLAVSAGEETGAEQGGAIADADS